MKLERILYETLAKCRKTVKNIHLHLNYKVTVRSIKKYETEIDVYINIRILQNLKGKMHIANEFGLTNLLRTCAH